MKTLPFLFALVVATTAVADNVVTLTNGRVLKNIWVLDVKKDTVVIWNDGNEEELLHAEIKPEDLAKLQPRIDEAKQEDKAYRDMLTGLRHKGGRLITKAGKLYEGVHLLEVEKKYIVIRHVDGAAHVQLDDLPDEVRESLMPDVAAAELADAARLKALKAQPGQQEWDRVILSATALKPQKLDIVVIQELMGGVIVKRKTKSVDIDRFSKRLS